MLNIAVPAAVPAATTVESLIYKHFAVELVEGVEGCTCGVIADHQSVRVLRDWPDVLIVQLLRTVCNKHTQINTKVMSAVTSFVDINLCGVSYACVAAVIHSGESVHTGHYISYLFHEGNVVRINNDHVSLVAQEQINNRLLYLLWYRRV